MCTSTQVVTARNTGIDKSAAGDVDGRQEGQLLLQRLSALWGIKTSPSARPVRRTCSVAMACAVGIVLRNGIYAAAETGRLSCRLAAL